MMNKKELSNLLNDEMRDLLVDYYGYKQIAKEQFKCKRDIGFDIIEFGISKYGEDYDLSLIVSRHYKEVEMIYATVAPLIDPSYRNDGSDLTLRFNEFSIEGKENSSKRYSIPNGYFRKSFDEIKIAVNSRIIPFLDSINTIDKLHDFINVPTETLFPKASIFYSGKALLRKVIIAKLADRNYVEVCDFIHDTICNVIKIEDKKLYEKYSKAFFQLIENLAKK